MPASFVLDNVEVRDPKELEEYRVRVAPVVARFGGRYLAVKSNSVLVEGL